MCLDMYSKKRYSIISRTSGEIALWILVLTFFKDQHSTLLKQVFYQWPDHNKFSLIIITVLLSDWLAPLLQGSRFCLSGLEKNPASPSSHSLLQR